MEEEIKKVEKISKEEEYLNGWKRERADFLNYKKEEMERIGQLVKYANEEIILKILPILDNFYLAEKHLPENPKFADGFAQIKNQLCDFLQKEGIEPIETIGKKFDANLMESVGTAFDEASAGQAGGSKGEIVSEEVQKGYTMHGKLIRPAKVKISK